MKKNFLKIAVLATALALLNTGASGLQQKLLDGPTPFPGPGSPDPGLYGGK